MIEILIIAVAALAGVGAGWIMSRRRSEQIIGEAKIQVTRVLEKAHKDATLTLREVEAQSREEAQQLRQASEALEQRVEDECALLEERIRKLDDRCARREETITHHSERLEEHKSAIAEKKAEAKAGRQEAGARRQRYREGLAERAGETRDQVKDRLVDAMVEETRAQCADLLRNLESTSSEEFMRQSKRVMGISIGRYTGRQITERVSSSLPLTPEQAGRLTARPEIMTVIEEMTSCRLAPSDSGESIRFESGDSVARELARRVVTRVVKEESIRDLPRLIKSVTADLEREIADKGKKAFTLLGLEPGHPEIINLLGRLNFRTSYTQNQWQHAIESAFLGGLMASELGLDVTIARRGTLLHDIGKALTHEVEGSHAVIGAEIARRCGEDEIVANAIGAHHGDEPANSPYAYLVAASDAMSGARPGARREMVETYVDRISDLERIGSQFPGVVHVHAVQAGREIRVLVDEKKVSDARAATLSDEIAEKISAELTFPGQIRVMVIREFKSVEFAS